MTNIMYYALNSLSEFRGPYHVAYNERRSKELAELILMGKKMYDSKEDLVSIIVVTFNSAKFVAETLESIKNQSYSNIELIISDDCSSDNTIEICRKWLEENKDRFVNTELSTIEEYTGIPSNCNRGIKIANGAWIKLIAGDDILDQSSISLLMSFCSSLENCEIVSSISQSFINRINNKKYIKTKIIDKLFFHKKTSAREQYRILLYECVIHAPNVFIKSDVFKRIGGFDERFRQMEDYPFWLKLTREGYKFYRLNEITVYYRIHSESTYNREIKKRIFNEFYSYRRDFEVEYIYPNVNRVVRKFYEIEFFRKELFTLLGLNRHHYLFKILYLFTEILSPLNIYKFFFIRILFLQKKISYD